MNLRLKEIERQQLILWGESYKQKCDELQVPFEQDEELLLNKIKAGANTVVASDSVRKSGKKKGAMK